MIFFWVNIKKLLLYFWVKECIRGKKKYVYGEMEAVGWGKKNQILLFLFVRQGGGGVGLAENFPDKRPQIIQIPLTIKEAYFLAFVFSEKDNY